MTPDDEQHVILVPLVPAGGAAALESRDGLPAWPLAPVGETALFERLRDLCQEGVAISTRMTSARRGVWHSFLPADYTVILRALLNIRESGGRFLEFGSATGVIAIMADLLGFDAYGIEIETDLVDEARELAARYGSGARFAAGSFIPAGYQFVSEDGDTRMGAVGLGEPAYAKLERELADFDWVYSYPWPGEAAVVRDLMQHCGAPHARLLLVC